MPGTPTYGHPPIAMCRVSDEIEWEGPKACGEFFWRDVNGCRVLVVAVPMNSNMRPLLTEWTIDHKNGCNAQWGWDGNEDAPTLTPSLHALGIWHGRISNGQLIEA
jgi:hypothetical protein